MRRTKTQKGQWQETPSKKTEHQGNKKTGTVRPQAPPIEVFGEDSPLIWKGGGHERTLWARGFTKPKPFNSQRGCFFTKPFEGFGAHRLGKQVTKCKRNHLENKDMLSLQNTSTSRWIRQRVPKTQVANRQQFEVARPLKSRGRDPKMLSQIFAFAILRAYFGAL